MATITKPYTFSNGAIIQASEHNSCFDTIYNDYNGNINNTNIASNAAIVGTKLDLTTVGAIGSSSPSTGNFTLVFATLMTANVIAVIGSVNATQVNCTGFFAASGTVNAFSAGTVVVTTALGAGTSSANAIYSDNIIKAWISFNGTGTPAERQSFNVASIGDEGVGTYQITWDRVFADANYSVVGCSGETSGADRMVVFTTADYTANWVHLIIRSGDSSITDEPIINLIAVGN
jgi:hypothetical protein